MINQRMLNQFMKQMKVENIDASRVIIEKTNGEKLIINNPKVVKMGLQGQESYNISGEVTLEKKEDISEEDVKLVMEKTGKSREEVISALKEHNGDIAETILNLTNN